MSLVVFPPSPMDYSATTSRGEGRIAAYIRKESDKALYRLQNSDFFGSLGEDVSDDLLAVSRECRGKNSDGYGALPLDPNSLKIAWQLLFVFPVGTPAPSVGADPEGHVTFEWYHRPRYVISMSVSPVGELHYAALMGPERAYGTEIFYGDPPQTVLELISRVMNE